MLSTLLVVFAAVFMVSGVRPLRKVKANQGCSNASLSGSYQLVMEGTYDYDASPPAGSYTWDFSMLAYFDGEGNVSATRVRGVWSGQNWGGGPTSFSGGEYTVNPDCTLFMTFPPGVSVFYGKGVELAGVVTEGDEALGIGATEEPWTGSFDATKVGE
jgi:hypothetical protein